MFTVGVLRRADHPPDDVSGTTPPFSGKRALVAMPDTIPSAGACNIGVVADEGNDVAEPNERKHASRTLCSACCVRRNRTARSMRVRRPTLALYVPMWIAAIGGIARTRMGAMSWSAAATGFVDALATGGEHLRRRGGRRVRQRVAVQDATMAMPTTP